jgi:uncharacterized protein (DUF1330 family)
LLGSENKFAKNLAQEFEDLIIHSLHGIDPMTKKAYLISAYHEVNNQDALAAYAALAAPALMAAGGRFLARGMPAAVKEHGKMNRTVLVEFDSLEQALAAYDSPAYQEAVAKLVGNAVVRDMRVIEAV